jgi:O-methyltransferase involved in polyketide biosynthesis
LYSKAVESRRERPIIVDPKAVEILRHIDYDFHALQIPKQSMVTLAMRAKKLDACVRDYLGRTDNPLVLHLGCGLDSRVLRIGDPRGQWYDLDYPDVIELRRKFYAETDRYHMIPSSVTDYSWLDRVKESGAACIIAEGLLMYLREKDIKELFAVLQQRWPGSEIAFDAYSRLTARSAGKHPLLFPPQDFKDKLIRRVCENEKKFCERLEEIIREGMAQGVLRQGSVEIASASFYSIREGLLFFISFFSLGRIKEYDEQKISAGIRAVWEDYWNGIKGSVAP